MKKVLLLASWIIASFFGQIGALFAGAAFYLGAMQRVAPEALSGPSSLAPPPIGYVLNATAALLGGAILGVLQYGVLRSFRFFATPMWILATAAGFAIPMIALYTTPPSSFFTVDVLLLIQGVLVGLLQWLLLRRRFPRDYLWIPAAAAGSLVLFTSALRVPQVLWLLLTPALTGILLVAWVFPPVSQSATPGA